MQAKNPAKNEVVFRYTRTYTAPREIIHRAFTDSAELAQWWGPAGMNIHVEKADIRTGGIFHHRMDAPDGTSMWGLKVYREITDNKITWVNSFADKNGNPVKHPMAPGWPLEMLNEITLTEKLGRTTVILESRPINCTTEEENVFAENFPSMEGGFGGTMNQLGDLVMASEAGRCIELSRTYKAPAKLVWLAWTSPEHLRNWWGPNGFITETKSMDVRNGGSWIYTMTGPDGTVFPNRIDYHEVVPLQKLVYHHGTGDDDYPDQFDVVITFEEKGNETTVTLRTVMRNAERLKYLVDNFGVIEGGKQTLARLDAVLAELSN